MMRHGTSLTIRATTIVCVSHITTWMLPDKLQLVEFLAMWYVKMFKDEEISVTKQRESLFGLRMYKSQVY